jgi:uncharacterized protein YbaP (TraB family)
MLQATVDEYASLPAMIEALVQAYLARNLAAMQKIGIGGGDNDMQQMSADFEQRLINDRNLLMAKRMQPQLQRGRAFVAIGALHLYGERGVLSLLQRAGWRLSRVY